MPEARLEEFLFDNNGNVGQAARTICFMTEKDIKRVDDKRNQISVTGGSHSTSNHSSRSRSKSTSRRESPARTYFHNICHPKSKQIFQQLFLNQIIHKIILVELMHSNLKSKHEKSVQKPESTFAQMMVSQPNIIHKKLLSSVNAQHKRTKKPQMKYFTKIIKNIAGIASLISMDFMLTKGSKNYAKN